MTIDPRVGDVFPDFELPDHRKKPRRLSGFTRPSLMYEQLSFTDGYPLIFLFSRGFFCRREQQHMRQLVQFQSELAVNFGKLITVSTDAPLVGAAFSAGLVAEGYRTLKPDAPARFEAVEGEAGQTARNIQEDGESE